MIMQDYDAAAHVYLLFLASCEISKISHTLRMIKSSYIAIYIFYTCIVDKQLLNDALETVSDSTAL